MNQLKQKLEGLISKIADEDSDYCSSENSSIFSEDLNQLLITWKNERILECLQNLSSFKAMKAMKAIKQVIVEFFEIQKMTEELVQ